jgi:hypothetical protein
VAGDRRFTACEKRWLDVLFLLRTRQFKQYEFGAYWYLNIAIMIILDNRLIEKVQTTVS